MILAQAFQNLAPPHITDDHVDRTDYHGRNADQRNRYNEIQHDALSISDRLTMKRDRRFDPFLNHPAGLSARGWSTGSKVHSP
jgi:hypothetical protein